MPADGPAALRARRGVLGDRDRLGGDRRPSCSGRGASDLVDEINAHPPQRALHRGPGPPASGSSPPRRSRGVRRAAAILVAVPERGVRDPSSPRPPAIVAGDAPVLSLTKGIERGTNATMTERPARRASPPRPSACSPARTSPRRSRLGMPAACVVAIDDEAAARLVQDRLHCATVPRLHLAGRHRLRGRRGDEERPRHRRGRVGRPRVRRQHPGHDHHPGSRRDGPPGRRARAARHSPSAGSQASGTSWRRARRTARGTGGSASRSARVASLAEAVEALGEVAEGVVSAEPLVALARDHGVELPICEQVAAMVTGARHARRGARRARPRGPPARSGTSSCLRGLRALARRGWAARREPQRRDAAAAQLAASLERASTPTAQVDLPAAAARRPRHVVDVVRSG